MNKTVKNVFFNVTYQILNIIIPLITAPYIARVMKPEGVGIYSYSNSIAGYFAVFMLLGIANYGSRTIAMSMSSGKRVLSEKFWEMYCFQLITSLVCITLFLILIFSFDFKYKTALLAQIFYLLSIALDISWYFAGTSQFRITVASGFTIKVLQTVAIFSIVKTENDIIKYILIMSFSSFISMAALWCFALKQISFVKVSANGIIQHIKPNLILFIPALASSVFVYMDKIMLGIIASSKSLGLYEYSEKIVRLPLTVIGAIGTVLMPRISMLVAENSPNEVKKYINLSVRYISLLAVAMGFGVCAIAPELALVYLGEDFKACGPLMQIMSIIIITNSFADIIRTQYLIPMKKEKIYIYSVIFGACINLILNGIFIPVLGSAGAAIGTIGAELTVVISYIAATFKELPFKKFSLEWLASISCGLVMLFSITVVKTFINSTFVRLAAGFIVGVISFSVSAVISLCLRKDRIIIDFIGRFKK